MSLSNCEHCGQLYVKARSVYCAECQEIYDGYYRDIRDFLRANPRSTVWDIRVKLDIPLKIMQRILKQEFKIQLD